MSKKTPQTRVLFGHCLSKVRAIVFGVFLIASVATSVASLVWSPSAEAATNNALNFQARLQTVGGAIVPDGYYNIEFKLYSAASGGSALWTESWYDANGATAGSDNRVRVKNGYLSVSLGSLTAFDDGINWDQDLWLTMNIGGTAQTASVTYDGEMNPRLKLTGVPYAFKAGQLAKFNSGTGYTSTLSLSNATGGNQSFVIPDQGAAGTYNLLTTAAASGSFIQNTTSQQTANFNISGNGTIGGMLTTNTIQAAASTGLALTGNASSSFTASSGNLTLAATSGNINLSANRVGIGQPSPDYKLDIAAGTTDGLRIQVASGAQWGLMINNTAYGNTNATGFGIWIDEDGSAHIDNNSNNGITMAPGGGVGINYVAPYYQLDVGGDINVRGSAVYRADGNAGTSVACSGGEFLQNANIIGGIVTGGGCAAVVGDGGVTTVGTFSNGTSYANGASISGTTITMGAADATNPGLVTADTQTFAGAKTFNNGINLASGQTYKINNVQITSAALSNDANLAKLDGTQTFSGDNTFSGNVGVGVASNNDDALSIGGALNVEGASGLLRLRAQDGSSTSAALYNAAGELTMYTGNNIRAILKADGKFGIGLNANPQYQLDVSGDANISSGSVYRINGVQISSANLSNNANLAKLDGTQTFTGVNTFSNAGNTYYGNGANLTALNASELTSGTVANGRLSGSYTGITGTGALAAGSIVSGFGTISTGNNITTTAELQGGTLDITGNAAIGGTLNVTGLVTLTDFNSLVATNAANTVISANTSSFAQAPMSSTLWHDLFAFSKKSTPTQERYNGSWNSTALNTELFSQKENQTLTVVDGSTYSAARWTWNNMEWSQGEWLNIGFTYSATGQDNDILVESSANGTTWTTRHTSVGNLNMAEPAWFKIGTYNGDPYIRVTITTDGSKPLNLSSMRLLTARWGDQGMGSELQYPYGWDDSQRIAVGAGAVVDNGVLTIGTNTTLASGGLYFGTDTNLYRSGAGELTTSGSLTASEFLGDGVNLTNLNATNLASGTVASGRISGSYTGITGTGALNAGSITSGFGTIDTGDAITGTAINATTKFQINGTDGLSSLTCSGGQFLQNAVIAGGIVTAGQCAAASNGVTTVGTFSNTSIANGASISGNTITFGAADATNPGMLSTGTQTIAGAKTFNTSLNINSASNNALITATSNDSGKYSGLYLQTNARRYELAVGGSSTGGDSNRFYIYDTNAGAYRLTLESNGNLGVGLSGAAGYKLDVSGDINSSTGYRAGGTAGVARTCTGGQVLTNQTTVGGITTGGTCATAGAASTLQDVYDGSGATNPQITLSNTNGGLKIRDGSTPVSGNLFQLQNNGGTATYFGVSATGATIQDGSGNNAIIIDTSGDTHLRLYANGTSPTLYADLYYDTTNSEAVFAASSGTTRVGNGNGNIALQLTNAADVLQASKTSTLSGAYSSSDFSFTRNITAGSNTLGGNVVSIQSTSTASGTNNNNLLYINEGASGTTSGNLILAQKGGSDRFKLDMSGNATIAGTTTSTGQVTASAGVSVAAGQSYTGAGAVTLSSGASTALTVTGNAASTFSTTAGALTITSATAATWGTTTGNLTLTPGGANGVIVKPGSNGTGTFQVQNTSSTALFTADTSNTRIQIGSSSTDATAVLLVIDSYNNGTDPTGVNGAMYYSTSTNKFRCYENGGWKDCIGLDEENNRKRPINYTEFFDCSTSMVSGVFTPGATSGGSASISTNSSYFSTSHPSACAFTASTTAGSAMRYAIGSSNGNSSISIAGGEAFEMNFLPTATTTGITIRAGYVDTYGAVSTDQEDGIYMEVSGSTLTGKTASNNTRSTTGTSYTVSAGTWYRIRVLVNSSATQATYYLYNDSGTQLWSDTLSTNLPTGTSRNTGAGVIGGNTSTSGDDPMIVDYMSAWYDSRALTR